jgi:hypothetical protein
MTIEQNSKTVAIFNMETSACKSDRSVTGGRFKNVNVLIDLKAKTINFTGSYHSKAFDKTFKVGDVVKTGSYNLIYTGKITNIGPKTISADGKRFTIAEFIDHNYDLDLKYIADHNAEERMYI